MTTLRSGWPSRAMRQAWEDLWRMSIRPCFVLKGPYLPRQSEIDWARFTPIPGSCVSSSTFAVLMFVGVGVRCGLLGEKRGVDAAQYHCLPALAIAVGRAGGQEHDRQGSRDISADRHESRVADGKFT